MRLMSVGINNFRSIATAGLEDCGDLNVLIGKNNSGKSNILAAIETFFAFFNRLWQVATPRPSVNAKTDWYGQGDDAIISISVSLEFDEAEASRVRSSIADEVPQMKNVLDEIYSSAVKREIHCELAFLNKPTRVGFIRNISFGAPGEEGYHLIFGLDTDAASELASRESEIFTLTSQARAMELASSRIDFDDWRAIKDAKTSGRIMLRRYDPSGELFPILNELIRSSSSLEEFRGRINAHIAEVQSRATELGATPNENKVDTFSGQSESVPEYVTTIVKLIGGLKVHHLSERRKTIGEDEARRILNLKMSRGQGDVLRDIQSTVSALLGVKIDAFSSGTPVRSEAISAELDVDDFLVQVNGSGIREALRLVLDYEFERPDILLVEEPEVHLHPALETAMMQYLRKVSSECQIFLTTHSTNFLDVADLRNVYLITKNVSTHVQLLNAEEAEEAIPEELGIRLSSLFLYDRLVFVEGPSDEQVLRSFASTLGIILSRAGVGFISTGGARNYAYYANANTLGFLAKRKVKLFFVLDRDERDLPEIVHLQERLGDLGELRVLERRELENYLIVPLAIATYIGSRMKPEEAPHIDDVQEAIKEACQALLITAMERRVLRL